MGIARRAVLVVLAGLLGCLAVATAGCGDDPSPAATVTVAKRVTKSNQGMLLKEMFDELDLKVTWGGLTNGEPPSDEHDGQSDGMASQPDGTKTGFVITLPGPYVRRAPAEGAFLKGIDGSAQIVGGPSFHFYLPGGQLAPRLPEDEADRMGAMNRQIIEGLCRKFTGRECGDLQPAAI